MPSPYNVLPATQVTPNSSTRGSSPIAINGPTSRRFPGSHRTASAALITGGDEDGALAVRPADRSRATPHGTRHEPFESDSARLDYPSLIEATLADRVYIDRSNLPPTLAHAIRRLATFSNPMFTELQRMRLSVARTPRVIGCFDDLDRHLALPRGCLSEVVSLVGELGVKLDLRDERVAGETLELEFRGELNESQLSAARAVLPHDAGVLCAPPGWGKTVLATSLIASRARSTLVLVHRKPLVEQWTERLSEFLGIAPKSIGQARRRSTAIDATNRYRDGPDARAQR